MTIDGKKHTRKKKMLILLYLAALASCHSHTDSHNNTASPSAVPSTLPAKPSTSIYCPVIEQLGPLKIIKQPTPTCTYGTGTHGTAQILFDLSQKKPWPPHKTRQYYFDGYLTWRSTARSARHKYYLAPGIILIPKDQNVASTYIWAITQKIKKEKNEVSIFAATKRASHK